jgi:hypothetical protein
MQPGLSTASRRVSRMSRPPGLLIVILQRSPFRLQAREMPSAISTQPPSEVSVRRGNLVVFAMRFSEDT